MKRSENQNIAHESQKQNGAVIIKNFKIRGIPAIVPHLKSMTPATVGAVQFTKSDVQIYLSTHPFSDAPIVNGGSQTVKDIQFVTLKDAKAIMKDSYFPIDSFISNPKNLVCLVTLYGPFSLSSSALPPILQRKGWTMPATTDIVYEIFDGQTGNLLFLRTPSKSIPPAANK